MTAAIYDLTVRVAVRPFPADIAFAPMPTAQRSTQLQAHGWSVVRTGPSVLVFTSPQGRKMRVFTDAQGWQISASAADCEALVWALTTPAPRAEAPRGTVVPFRAHQ